MPLLVFEHFNGVYLYPPAPNIGAESGYKRSSSVTVCRCYILPLTWGNIIKMT